MKLRTKLLVALLCSTIVPIVLVCIVVGYNIKNTSLASFYRTTGNELGHIEKAISLFIGSVKNSTSLIARHPAVTAADASINSYVNRKEPASRKDLPPLGTEEKPIMELAETMRKAIASFVEVYIGTK